MENAVITSSTIYPEPSAFEIFLMAFFGKLLSSFYKEYVDRLDLKGNEQVLELGPAVGSSTRHLAKRLLKNGGSITAVDISQMYAEAARKRLSRFPNVTIIAGDITTLYIEDESFNTGFINFVLHDIPASEQTRIMKAFTSKIEPGGKLFIREPLRFIEMGSLIRILEESGLLEINRQVKEIKTQGRIYEGIFQKPDIITLK